MSDYRKLYALESKTTPRLVRIPVYA